MEFKIAIQKKIEEAGHSIDDLVPTKHMTFKDVIEYYSNSKKDNYDHDLLHEIEMHKWNNIDIKFLFIGKIEAIERAKNIYNQ